MRLTKELLSSNLSNKDIEDIDSLKGISCTKLDLSRNKLKTVSELSSLALSWLNLSKNQILQFPFEHFPLLSMLNVGHNEIEEVKQVSRCKKLKALILNNNHLQKAHFTEALPIESLDYRGCGLKELRQLSLSCNQLQQFPDLKENSKLRQLRLNGNQIMELPKEKDNFPSWLEILDLGNNQIKKLSQVKGLMHCSRLRNLNLKGNPVCDTPMYKEALCALIPTLRILDGQPLEKKKKEEEQFNETDRLDKHVNDIEQASPLKKKRKATEEPAERTPIKNTKKKSVKEKEPANEAKDISGVIKVIETKKSKEAIDPSNLLTEMAEIPGWD